MYNEHHRATAEARLIKLTIRDDTERGEAWRLLDGTGPGVRLDIGKGVMLECLVGKPRPLSWWLWCDLKGVESPARAEAQARAVLQSAGLGSAEMSLIGQPAPGACTTWVRCEVPEEALWYPMWRKVGDGHYQVVSREFFDRKEKAQRYLKLRCNEANPAAGSFFVPVVFSRPPGGRPGDLPDPEVRQPWLVTALEEEAEVAAYRVALAARAADASEASAPAADVSADLSATYPLAPADTAAVSDGIRWFFPIDFRSHTGCRNVFSRNRQCNN
jgi:hypothetical protein